MGLLTHARARAQPHARTHTARSAPPSALSPSPPSPPGQVLVATSVAQSAYLRSYLRIKKII